MSNTVNLCINGFVWRNVRAGEHVCVTPQTRSDTTQENGVADSRRSPNRGAYGKDTWRAGYVLREAFDGDHVCVTPKSRTRTRAENAATQQRAAYP